MTGHKIPQRRSSRKSAVTSCAVVRTTNSRQHPELISTFEGETGKLPLDFLKVALALRLRPSVFFVRIAVEGVRDRGPFYLRGRPRKAKEPEGGKVARGGLPRGLLGT